MRALFKVLSIVPLSVLHGLGWILGWAVFLCSPSYRGRLLANARQAEIGDRAAFESVGAAGQLVTELARLWFGAPVSVKWDGDALVEDALANGKGVIFLTPHLGCFEVTAQAYAQRFGQHGSPITVLFRPPRQPWLRPMVESSRQRPGLQTAPTTLAGVKQMVRALKRGECVGLLPDQVPPLGLGVWAPFFGRDAYTMTLSARLAAQTGAIVLLAWGERLSWGRGYIVHFESLELPLTDELSTAVRSINAGMERLILEAPHQYLWGYARYKQPAQGAP
jgi:Kdo2-lipid IVA lauroyltransferase/acyltransferase